MIPAASPRRRSCKVCRLPAAELDLLNGGLKADWSARSLAKRFKSVGRKDIIAHARHCTNNEDKEDEC
jgi:hypothetical protein